MFRVDTATLAPAMCMFTKSATGPFIDLGRDFDFDHVGRVYIREEYARELGRFVGLVDPDALGDGEREELEGLRGKVAQLEEEIAELDGALGAIDVLESRDFRARKRPGRRPKQKTEVELEEAA